MLLSYPAHFYGRRVLGHRTTDHLYLIVGIIPKLNCREYHTQLSRAAVDRVSESGAPVKFNSRVP